MPKMSFSGESDNPGYRSEPHVTDSGESDTWRDTEERERERKRGGRREPKERKIRGENRKFRTEDTKDAGNASGGREKKTL